MTLAQLHAILAAWRRCSTACKGWFVSDEGTDRCAVVACDECRHAYEPTHPSANKRGTVVLYDDDDIQLLPEAQIAIGHCRMVREVSDE